LDDPQVKARLAGLGFFPVGACGADFAAILRRQFDEYGALIGEANIKADEPDGPGAPHRLRQGGCRLDSPAGRWNHGAHAPIREEDTMRLVIGRGRRAAGVTAALLLNSALCVSGLQNAAAAEPQLEKAIEDGKALFLHETFEGNGMTCDSCHVNGGVGEGRTAKRPAIPSLSNAATIYPRFEARKNKVVTLENKIQNCVAGALQGKPPAYGSEQMTGLVAYVTSLAQGKPVNLGGKPE
jgi:thiosulfate dehydrogenase